MNILALDIDGTLIDTESRDTESEELKCLANYCIENNFKIILVTGRSLEGVCEVSNLIDQLKPGHIITNCGIEIFERVENCYISLLGYEKFINQINDEENQNVIEDNP